MKTRLEELTIGEFVDLMAGEHKVLGAFKKYDRKVAHTVRDIIMEYRAIVDPNGTKAYLSDSEDYNKAKNMVMFFTICAVLVEMRKYEHVREVVAIYGMSVERMSDSRLTAEIKGKLAKAKNTLARLEDEGKTLNQDVDVRKEFDEQTASLMAHFKFQIDMTSMKATLYAHLVARLQREIKAQQAALNKMKK